MNGTTREKRFCRAVLWGEGPTEPAQAGAPSWDAEAAATAFADLPERDRAAAETVRERFRRELAAPPFDRAKLLQALRKSAPPSPALLTAARRRAWRIVAVAALLALCAGLGWALLGGPDAPTAVVPVPAPPDRPVFVAERLPDGRWRYGEAATLAPRGASPVEADPQNGRMILRAGRAELVCDGRARERVEVLETLNGFVGVAVQGPSRTGLRVLPGGRGLAFSVYEGARESVTVTPRLKWPPAVLAGRDMDGLVFKEDQARESGPRVALWPDVTAALPPVTHGDVYLRLASGSVVRGQVVANTGEALRVLGTRALVTGGAETRPVSDVPESILAREVAAWTPAETPRGRDTYASWLDECASAQLLDARRAWLVYLSEQEVGRAHERTPAEFLATQRPLPETDLRLARRGDAPVLQLVPRDPDFGPGWELNERGEVTRIAPDAPAKGQEF